MNTLNITAPWRASALLVVLGLAIALAATACGGGKTAQKPTATQAAAVEIPTVDITATDGHLDAPASIPGGLTRIRLHNAGKDLHQAALWRLKDGATPEQFLAAYKNPDFATGKTESLALVTLGGGTNLVSPGGTSEAILDLQPGRYVLLCYGPVGIHWALGEFRPLEVTAAPAARPSKPEAQATVRTHDFAFDAPDTLPAGRTTVNVVNDAQQLHEMWVVRIKDATKVDQVRQGFLADATYTTSPDIAGAGGMAELLPGQSGWATLDLTPGAYALVCNVSDLGPGSGKTGKNHAQLGMYHAFTVQ